MFFPLSTWVQKATTVRVHRRSLSLKIATLSIHLKHPIPGWVKGAWRWGRGGLAGEVVKGLFPLTAKLHRAAFSPPGLVSA